MTWTERSRQLNQLTCLVAVHSAVEHQRRPDASAQQHPQATQRSGPSELQGR